MRRPGRLVTFLVCVGVGSLVLAANAEAATFSGPTPSQAPTPSPGQTLVDAYAPILMLREQMNGLGDTTEEQYKPPTTVDSVLGNPMVNLVRYTGGRSARVKRAPTAAD